MTRPRTASSSSELGGTVLTELRRLLGDGHVLDDPDRMAGYLTDWTGAWTGAAGAVVRPGSTEETAGVLRLADEHGLAVCVQGGNTGLVGGSVPPGDPAGPTLLLSTTRLTDIGRPDLANRCIEAGAGATVAAIDAAARTAGLRLGIDLAARDSATAGGVVATNAGGIHMVSSGNTRAQLLGVEAVLADGRILRRMHRLVKDNVGYDLPGLLTGSEGTLAVITRVLFSLITPPAQTAVTVIAVDDAAAAGGLLHRLRAASLKIEAAELMTDAGVALVTATGLRPPLTTSAGYQVLIEVSGPGDLPAAVSEVLAASPEVTDAVVEAGPARALWRIREAQTEAIARSSATPVVKLDVAVPLDEIPGLLDAVDEIATTASHPCRPILFGHVGDGNIHVNLLDVPAADADALAGAVFAAVTERGGSISAEHGVGRLKTGWTGLGRSEVDRSVMRAIKSALDPAGRLNPGVLFIR